MGRKRKIPPGYIPTWNIDSETSMSDTDFIEHQRLPAADNLPQDYFDPGDPLDPVAPVESSAKRQKNTHDEEIMEQTEERNVILVPPQPIEEDMESEEDLLQQQVQIEVEEQFDHISELEHEITSNSDGDVVAEEQEEQEQENDNDEVFEQLEQHFFSALEEHFPEEQQEHFQGDDWSSEEENQIDKDSFKYQLSEFSKEWMLNQLHHKVSKEASSSFWNISAKWMFALTSSFLNEKKKKFPKFTHIRRKFLKQNVPEISLETAYIHKESQEFRIVCDTEKVPVRQFPPDEYEKVFEIASVKVQYNFHIISTYYYFSQFYIFLAFKLFYFLVCFFYSKLLIFTRYKVLPS